MDSKSEMLVCKNTSKVYGFGVVRWGSGRHDGHVSVDVRYSFDVLNTGKDGAKYAPVIMEEHVCDPVFVSVSYGGELIAHDELRKHLEVRDISNIHSIDGLPEVQVSPGESIRCEWCYGLTMPVVASDVTAFGRRSESLELVVEHAPNGMRFECDGEMVRNRLAWRYDESFVPRQHVRLYWMAWEK